MMNFVIIEPWSWLMSKVEGEESPAFSEMSVPDQLDQIWKLVGMDDMMDYQSVYSLQLTI